MALYSWCGFFSFLAGIIGCFGGRQYAKLIKHIFPTRITFKNDKEKNILTKRTVSLSEHAEKINTQLTRSGNKN